LQKGEQIMSIQKKSIKPSGSKPAQKVERTNRKTGGKAMVATKNVNLKKAAIYFPPDPC